MDTLTISAPTETVPEIPAETLETIPTAPRRLSAAKIDRTPTPGGEPRAWVVGGSVD